MGSFPRNLNEVYEKAGDFNRVEVYERVRISVVPFRSAKRPKRAYRCILWLRKTE